MPENEDRHAKTDAPDTADEGVPKQALSGGGFEPAGSAEGGSAYGDDREDALHEAPETPQGDFKADTAEEVAAGTEPPAEEKRFASPDGQEGSPSGSTETVNNTGEPRPVKNGEGVEGQAGGEADAATG